MLYPFSYLLPHLPSYLLLYLFIYTLTHLPNLPLLLGYFTYFLTLSTAYISYPSPVYSVFYLFTNFELCLPIPFTCWPSLHTYIFLWTHFFTWSLFFFLSNAYTPFMNLSKHPLPARFVPSPYLLDLLASLYHLLIYLLVFFLTPECIYSPHIFSLSLPIHLLTS